VLDRAEVEAALELDPAWSDAMRRHWTALVALAVLGDVKTQRLGALPRLRRKVLDLGERLRSVLAAREWIPQPRDQLKNALASALSLRESFAQVRSGAADLDAGADLGAFNEELEAIGARLVDLEPRMNAWAALLARRSEEDDNASPA
jgi:hypothetical protein